MLGGPVTPALLRHAATATVGRRRAPAPLTKLLEQRNANVALLLAMPLLGVLAWELVATWTLLTQVPHLIGHDFAIYRGAASNWLTGSGFYPPDELTQPFDVRDGVILYPPIGLMLFVPFLVLPDALWWTPVVVTAVVVLGHRPKPWAWIAILVLLVFPITSFSYSATLDMILNGNPAIWTTMIVALATRLPFFGPFVLLKPTPLLAPFALVGVRSMSWWIGAATFFAACVAWAPLWIDYIHVLMNIRALSFGYGPSSVFPALIPIIAWMGSRRRGEVRGVRADLRAGREAPSHVP